LDRQITCRAHRRARGRFDIAFGELGEIDFAQDGEFCHLADGIGRAAGGGKNENEDEDEMAKRFHKMQS
jgi:hypothetical protein